MRDNPLSAPREFGLGLAMSQEEEANLVSVRSL